MVLEVLRRGLWGGWLSHIVSGHILAGLFVAVGGMVVSLPVSAQDATGPDAPVEVAQAAPGQPALDTIFTTARKRVEPLQDTPVAATVLSGEQLTLGFYNDLKTLQFPAPNVNIAGIGTFPNAVSISIRGITNADIDSSIDPPVAVFVDGVYLARPAANSLDLFDVEAIEILRGPQGTIFGRNTTAGAIQVRTRRPSGEFGFRGRITAGQFGRIDIRTSVEAPIVKDKVAAKVAFLSQNMDGYYRSAVTGERLGSEDIIAIRPILQFTPSDAFDLTIIGEYQRNKSEVRPQQNASTATQTLCVVFGECGIPFGEGNEYLVPIDRPFEIDVETWGVTVEANWDVGPGTITSISNYREIEEFVPFDVDATPANLFFTTRDQPHEQYSSELRFASTAWDRFGFVAGVYYFHQEYTLERRTWIFTDPATATPNVSVTGQKHDSFSVFFEGNYDVTDKLVFIAGGRWSWERKNFFQQPFFPGEPGPLIDVDPVSWDNFGPKIGVEYHWADDLMTYFTWSRGFKSGGFNGRCGQSITCLRAYDPETVDGFEVGLKGEFFDRRMRVNLALFWNEYEGLQRTVIVPLIGAANPQETVTDNAATATIRGIELEVTALPFEGMQIDLGLGVLDAKYGDFCADLNGASPSIVMPTSTCGDVLFAGDLGGDGIPDWLVDEDLSALELARAPKFTFSLGLTYTFAVGNMGDVILNARWAHASKMFLDANNRSQRKSTNLIDASISFEDADGRYRVSVFGRNLTDDVYLSSETLVANLLNSRTSNPPRRWGIEIGWDL